MRCFKKFSGFTLIEIVVAMFIVALVLSAIVMSFQNFSSFNRWIIQFSSLQKSSLHDVSLFEKVFAQEQSLIDTKRLSPDFERLFTRDIKTTQFHLADIVSSSTKQEISNETLGKLAFHNGVLFGGMELVGNDLFFVDTGNHVVRRVNLSSGSSEIYAGEKGVAGATNLLALSSSFRNPTGIAYYQGKLYVADTGNHAIRSIVVDDNTALRRVETVMGIVGVSGNAEGDISQALFSSPTGIAINNNGEIYVADTGNHVIKKISNNFSFTLLGTAGESGKGANVDSYNNFSHFSLNTPTQLVFDNTTNALFINDFENKRILRLSEGVDVRKVSEGDEYYGDIRILKDDLEKPYLVFQNISSGNIDALDLVDLTITRWFSAVDFSSTAYNPKMLLQHSFIKNGENYVVWGVDKQTNDWQLYFIQTALHNASQLFGSVSLYGQLSFFDPAAYVFNSYEDTWGMAPVILLDIRENPSNFDSRMIEVATKFLYGDLGAEDSIELSYSFILGNALYDF